MALKLFFSSFSFDSSFFYFFSFHFSPLSDLNAGYPIISCGCRPTLIFFVLLFVCKHTVSPIVSLVSRPLEASSDQTGNGHGEMTGYTELSCLFSCVMPRSLGYSQTEFNYRVSERPVIVVSMSIV